MYMSIILMCMVLFILEYISTSNIYFYLNNTCCFNLACMLLSILCLTVNLLYM